MSASTIAAASGSVSVAFHNSWSVVCEGKNLGEAEASFEDVAVSLTSQVRRGAEKKDLAIPSPVRLVAMGAATVADEFCEVLARLFFRC